MAPEMMILLSQAKSQAVGYDNLVDWWSLGATIFKLLTGRKPFDSLVEDLSWQPSETARRKAVELGWNVNYNLHMLAVLENVQFPGTLATLVHV